MKSGVMLLLVLAAAGCSKTVSFGAGAVFVPGPDASAANDRPAAPAAVPTLVAGSLLGPFSDRDDACSALTGSSLVTFPFGSPTCSVTPIDSGLDGEAAASLLTIRDAAPSNRRLSGAGAYFLGLSMGRAWFVSPVPLDEARKGATSTYVPTISTPATSVPGHGKNSSRLLFVFRDSIQALCNACDANHRTSPKDMPVEPHGLVIVCGRVGSGKPQCTSPLAVKAGSEVSLDSSDELIVAPPGAGTIRYRVTF